MNGLPDTLVEAFLRLCQGDFSYRLPRTMTRDVADTSAFFFNSIADEIERILRESRDQEQRLGVAVDRMSAALTRLAAGDLDVEVERDYRGDPVDVLAFLVNNMAAELNVLVEERERAAREREAELARLVDERTARLRESEEGFRRLFEAAPVPMVLIDVVDGTVRAANERAKTVLDVPGDELVGLEAGAFFEEAAERRRLVELLEQQKGLDAVVTRLVARSGRAFWCLVSARPLSLGDLPTWMVSFQDITEQKRIEAMLLELATKDSLTGVLNRRRFFEVAEEEFARSSRYGSNTAVALLDLDHFKAINDRFGHLVGDEALRETGKALSSILRRPDHVARYGGEEFALLLPETSQAGAEAIAERARAVIEGLELTHEGTPVPLTASLGVAVRRPGESLLAALNRADRALYRAKERGRNRVEGASEEGELGSARPGPT